MLADLGLLRAVLSSVLFCSVVLFCLLQEKQRMSKIVSLEENFQDWHDEDTLQAGEQCTKSKSVVT